jgi:anti-anti-sigma factor
VAVILDLGELTFMDSIGLHVILTARARLAEAGCRLVLLKGRRQVPQIFELTGVDGMLEFVSASDVHGLAAVQRVDQGESRSPFFSRRGHNHA